jgi:Icc-related predicted phosphoesterase
VNDVMGIRIFFATDIHGSERCWMKFVNAGKFYNANILILGGDLTAKGFVTLIEQPNGKFETVFRGKELTLQSEEELERVEKMIRAAGFYTYRTTPQEIEELSRSDAKREEVTLRLAMESLERWIQIADERLEGTNIKLYLTAGNDDPFEIDSILRRNWRNVIDAEGKVVRLDGDHEMISTGYGNITPWKCPRDVSEEKLSEKIDMMISQVEDVTKCIFNFHVPPYDSRLDDAPEIDEEFKMKYSGAKLVPVGSRAVRAAIERYQPLLALHGHIHESKGSCNIGRTLCLNPGSAYTEGVLQGVLIDLDKKGVKGFVPTSG